MPFLNLNAKLLVTLIETTTYNNNNCLEYVKLFEILVPWREGVPYTCAEFRRIFGNGPILTRTYLFLHMI